MSPSFSVAERWPLGTIDIQKTSAEYPEIIRASRARPKIHKFRGMRFAIREIAKAALSLATRHSGDTGVNLFINCKLPTDKYWKART